MLEVMVTAPDPLTLLDRAVEQTGNVIAHAQPAQAGLPTPCRSWDVQALVEHMVLDVDQFTAAATGGRPDWSRPVPAVANGWNEAFRDRAAALVAAWHDAGDLGEVVHLPIGDLPRSFVVNQQIAEFAVHAWDLARATGQDSSLDPVIAGQALAWAKTALRPEFRGPEDAGKAFGPEVDADDDAPMADRLAAYFGRDPAWRS